MKSQDERIAELTALLKEHHDWHLKQGVQDETLNGIDMGAEYADSDMYERTKKALGHL